MQAAAPPLRSATCAIDRMDDMLRSTCAELSTNPPSAEVSFVGYVPVRLCAVAVEMGPLLWMVSVNLPPTAAC